jgi:alanine racemase
MSTPSPRGLRCWAEIDLAALERNLRKIRAALPAHMRYVAVVKADAYGHGLHHVAARLMHAGADLFAVANVTEAAALRELGPGWPILVLSPLLPEEDPALADADLAATVSSADELERFEIVGRRAGRPISIHLKIDTGMGRAGVWHEDAPALFARIAGTPHVTLRGVFTHFASADEDVAFTAEQRRRFLAALGKMPQLNLAELFVHADNSAGIETLPGTVDSTGSPQASPFNAVRVGLLQFGIFPHAHSLLAQVRTEPVFSFVTRVGLVKRLPRGTTISYGRSHTLRRDSVIAVLCAGYADGLPRAASNRGEVLIHGRRCPILGRVTMDQTIVDVTDVKAVACGDEAVLVGRQGEAEITLADFSRAADTIPWETLTSVTKRVPRLYKTPLGV